MVRNEDILKDILLKMNYDSSKTLYENIQEQGMMQNGSLIGTIPPQEPQISALKQWQENYPNQCKYPSKASFPQEPKALAKRERLIQGFCYYTGQISSTNQQAVAGIWIPYTADVKFWDQSQKNKLVDDIIRIKLNDPESSKAKFWKVALDHELPEIVNNLYVDGAVRRFEFGSNKVVAVIQHDTPDSTNTGSYRFSYYGYIPSVNGTWEEYIQPTFVDTRTELQTWLDEYGTWAQLGVAVIFGLASIFTGGVAALVLIGVEIVVEGGLGYLMAQREWEKGNEAAGWFELGFALTPMLKPLRAFRGVTWKQVKAIADKMRKFKLPLNNLNANKLEEFIKTLDKTELEIFTRVMKDATDEWTEAQVKLALAEGAKKEFMALIKQSPDLLRRVEWYQKVAAREGFVQAGIMLGQFGYEAVFGKQLTEQEELTAQGIILTIDKGLEERLASDIIYQITTNPENMEKLVAHGDEIANKISEEIITPEEGRTLNKTIKERNAKRLERIFDEYGMDIDYDNIQYDPNYVDIDPESGQPEINVTARYNTPPGQTFDSVTQIRDLGWKRSKRQAINAGPEGCSLDDVEEQILYIAGNETGTKYYRCPGAATKYELSSDGTPENPKYSDIGDQYITSDGQVFQWDDTENRFVPTGKIVDPDTLNDPYSAPKIIDPVTGKSVPMTKSEFATLKNRLSKNNEK